MSLLARERYVPLPLIFLVWANAHGGVIIGDALVVVAFVTAALRARARGGVAADRRRLMWLGVMVPLCLLATAATPLGFGFFRFVLASEGRLREAHINEWKATLPGLSVNGVFWLLALAFVALGARRWRQLRDADWSDWIIVACAATLLALAFRSLRHIGPFLLLAPAAASRTCSVPISACAARPRSASHRPSTRGANAALLAVAVAAAVATIVVGWSRPFEELGWRPLPEGALAAIRACPGPLYNHYNEGGYLIWLTPERPVFIDNRQDPFPLPFLLEHVRVESGHAHFAPLFAHWGIRCSFLGVGSPTVAALTRAGWRDLYRDDKWAVQAATR